MSKIITPKEVLFIVAVIAGTALLMFPLMGAIDLGTTAYMNGESL